MRVRFLALLFVPLMTAPALAQSPTPATAPVPPQPSATPAPGAPPPAGMRSPNRVSITRDEYIEAATARVRKAAAARFDKMDTNHDGILTIEERRAARIARERAPREPQ